MRDVAVYIDEGASFEILMRSLGQEIDGETTSIRPLMASDLLRHGCLENVSVFVMPGGADIPYCSKLNGEGTAVLQQFVFNGGTYLGSCAGAYFACRELAFHVGRWDEVAGLRELALINAVAEGSIEEIGPLYDLTIASASAARIEWEGVGAFRGYYHGGPYFRLDAGEDVHVFARYLDKPDAPAALEKQIGRGRVVLTGIHVEVSFRTLTHKLAHLSDGAASRHLASLLEDHEAARRSAFRDLLRRAGVPLRAA